jgi:hypothetical protein
MAFWDSSRSDRAGVRGQATIEAFDLDHLIGGSLLLMAGRCGQGRLRHCWWPFLSACSVRRASCAGKDLSTSYIMFRHVLRPASLDVFTLIALNLGALMAGTVVVESVFGIGGLGLVLFEGSMARDQYVLMGITTYGALVYGTINFL